MKPATTGTDTNSTRKPAPTLTTIDNSIASLSFILRSASEAKWQKSESEGNPQLTHLFFVWFRCERIRLCSVEWADGWWMLCQKFVEGSGLKHSLRKYPALGWSDWERQRELPVRTIVCCGQNSDQSSPDYKSGPFTGYGRFPRFTSISTEVKNEWIFTFTFLTLLYNVLLKQRDSLAFASALISSFTGKNIMLI